MIFRSPCFFRQYRWLSECVRVIRTQPSNNTTSSWKIKIANEQTLHKIKLDTLRKCQLHKSANQLYKQKQSNFVTPAVIFFFDPEPQSEIYIFYEINSNLLRSSISFKSLGVSLSEWICSRRTSVHECKDSIMVHGLEISTTCTITVFVTLLGVSAYCRRLLWRGSPSNIQTPSRVVSNGSRKIFIVRCIKKEGKIKSLKSGV